MPDMTKRSGTNKSYAERKRTGRPIASFTLPEATIQELSELSEMIGISKSAVVALAISELRKKKKSV